MTTTITTHRLASIVRVGDGDEYKALCSCGWSTLGGTAEIALEEHEYHLENIAWRYGDRAETIDQWIPMTDDGCPAVFLKTLTDWALDQNDYDAPSLVRNLMCALDPCHKEMTEVTRLRRLLQYCDPKIAGLYHPIRIEAGDVDFYLDGRFGNIDEESFPDEILDALHWLNSLAGTVRIDADGEHHHESDALEMLR